MGTWGRFHRDIIQLIPSDNAARRVQDAGMTNPVAFRLEGQLDAQWAGMTVFGKYGTTLTALVHKVRPCLPSTAILLGVGHHFLLLDGEVFFNQFFAEFINFSFDHAPAPIKDNKPVCYAANEL